MIRRYGRPPVRGQQYTYRPGAYAILLRDGKVLVTYQGDPHFEYQLPGGGIDPGESPVQALHREVYEETGYRIAHPRKIGAFRRFGYMPEYDLHAVKICHIYLAFPVRPLVPPVEEAHRAVWMRPEEALADLYNEGDASFLASLIG